jgi:hypothetical protein
MDVYLMTVEILRLLDSIVECCQTIEITQNDFMIWTLILNAIKLILEDSEACMRTENHTGTAF